MKFLKCLLVILIIACTSLGVVCAADDISLYLDGKILETDVAPIIESGRTFVPVRSIFEKLGADVSWISAKRQVIIRGRTVKIVFNLDSDIAYVNDEESKLDVAPFIKDGRTLVPLRFVSEELGYSVKWEESTRSVHIDTKNVQAPVRKEPQITKINAKKNGESTVVTISVANMKKPKISYADAPLRFIADFEGASLSVSGSAISVGTNSVKEVRYAIHPDYTRIVIESPETVKYNIKYTADAMIVTLTAQGGSTSEPETDDDTEGTYASGIVVVDAGHGGTDCGAVGYDEDGEPFLYESEVNLSIAKKVRYYLELKGVDVIMTRTGDVALGKSEMEDLLHRSEIANDADASLFVSIHCNSFTEPTATGTEILYADTEDKIYNGITSKELAKNILTPLLKATELTNRGLKDSPRIVVLRTTKMPSVLIETAFVSNPDDLKVLADEDKIDEIGYSIAEGIIKSLGSIK